MVAQQVLVLFVQVRILVVQQRFSEKLCSSENLILRALLICLVRRWKITGNLKKMSRHLHADKPSSCPTCPIILIGFSHHIFSGCFYFPNTHGKKLVPVKDCYIIHAKVIRKKPFCNIKQRLLCKLKSRGGHRQWKLSETNT